MSVFKKYLYIAKNSFTNTLSDPGRFYSFIISHSATAFMVLVFWNAVFRIYPNFKGYNYNSIVLYYLTITLLNRLVGTGSSAKAIEEQIAKGSLSFRLLNPISFNLQTFIRGVGNRVALSLPGIVIFIIITIIFNPQFIKIDSIVLFVIALILSIILNYYIYAIVGVLAFYTVNTWGFRSALGRISDLAGGKTFPLDMLPTSLSSIFTFLPFSYSTFFVLQIYLNKINTNQAITQLPIQFSWTVLFIFIYSLVFNLGIKHYESVGI